eukprot:Stramenopile-MAST_4_protein_4806
MEPATSDERQPSSPASMFNVCVVSDGATETGPSVLISLSKKHLLGGEIKPFLSFVVNPCEGFQRTCKESRIKLKGIEHVLCTSLCPDRTLGLPGLALGLGDVGGSTLTVHGPTGTCEYVEACRPFFPRTWPEVKTVANIPSDTDDGVPFVIFQDEHVKWTAMPLGGILTASARQDLHPRPKRRRVDKEGGGHPPATVMYVCQTKRPLVKETVAFVECCLSDDTIAAVVAWMHATLPVDRATTLFHCFPPMGVTEARRKEYEKCWAKTPWKHIYLTRERAEAGADKRTMYRSSAKFQNELHAVAPSHFQREYMEASEVEREKERDDEKNVTAEVEDANKMVADSLRRELLDGKVEDLPAPGCMDLIFLGTGSAAPSKLRNSSAIYVRRSAASLFGNMLIDVGEGTFGQFQRMYGFDGVDVELRRLGMIWISHHHIDHHLGLLRILERRSQLRGSDLSFPPPLVVIGPQSVRAFLQAFVPPQLLQGILYVTFGEYEAAHHIHQILYDQMGIQFLQNVPVLHCHNAYGLVVDLRSGEKLVYSGDTRPCRALAAAGLNATVLIHEATFDDSMVESAKKKRHSTVSEALSIGHQMHARSIVLTHFSQRYPTVVSQSNGEMGTGVLDAKCILAFDLMRITLTEKGLEDASVATSKLRQHFVKTKLLVNTK